MNAKHAKRAALTGLAIALCCVAGIAAAGEVYKWVDPKGGVHYSDMPQAGWKRVETGSAQAVVNEAGSDAAGTDEDAAATRLKAEQCERAKSQLAKYKKSSTIVERDALGNERTYDAEQRLQLLQRTQQEVQDYCGAEALAAPEEGAPEQTLETTPDDYGEPAGITDTGSAAE